jgi:hypothetical protein
MLLYRFSKGTDDLGSKSRWESSVKIIVEGMKRETSAAPGYCNESSCSLKG